MWEIQHNTVDWNYSKTQTLLETLKIRNRHRVILCTLWNSNVRSFLLDVQETSVSIPQFYRIRNHFVGRWTVNGWFSRTVDLWYLVIEVLHFSINQLVQGNLCVAIKKSHAHQNEETPQQR